MAAAGHTISGQVSDSTSLTFEQVQPRAWAAQPLVVTWLLAFAAVLAFLWPLAMLFDSDSYYHLALARAYLERGLFSDLPWARFSVMYTAFADKELLFHVLLLPAAAARDPLLAAKLTLAALDATILTSIGWLAVRAAGKPALVLPALLSIGSFWFDMRLIRLRPELLALLLLLWTVHALSERRVLLAAACAGAFAYGYTAFHALLGICGLCFALRFVLDRKPNWGLLLGPVLAVALALLLHPHFPQNLRIFYLQNVEFWRYQHTDDIGNEILALGVGRWLRYDWSLLLGCVVLGMSLRRGDPVDRATRDAGLTWCVAALPLVLLFVHSGRFAVYGIPFGVLTALWATRCAGWRLDTRLSVRGWRGPQTWLLLLLLGCLDLPLTAAALQDQAERAGSVWPAQRNDLEAVGRALPAAAKVAATWDSAEDLMYFAPQAHYLNVLDPLFMRAAHPAAYAVQRDLFDGKLRDVPLALQAVLDSDYLAFSARKYPALREQLAADPRAELVVPRGMLLYRVRPERAAAFVRDYRVASTHAQLLQPLAARYAAGRGAEGIVDGARLAPSLLRAADCIWFAPEAAVGHEGAGAYELASTAPARVWRGEQQIATLTASAQLRLGQGTRVFLPEIAGFALELCPISEAPPSFYMLRRD